MAKCSVHKWRNYNQIIITKTTNNIDLNHSDLVFNI